MFDGTDLSLAYGSSYDNSMSGGMGGGMGGMGGGMGGMGGLGGMGGGSSMTNPQQSMMHNPVPVSSEQVNVPKSTASHQVVPDVPYVVPDTIYTKQNSGGNYNNSKFSSSHHQMNYNESFWDRLANKKWEVFKLFIMALIIMLGLSLHGVVNYYLDKYIGSSFLTEMQEVAIRLSYPVAIILFIWIVKASA
jgi:hypothetical protein